MSRGYKKTRLDWVRGLGGIVVASIWLGVGYGLTWLIAWGILLAEGRITFGTALDVVMVFVVLGALGIGFFWGADKGNWVE